MKDQGTNSIEPDFGRLELFMLGLIIANLLAFSIETALPAESDWAAWLEPLRDLFGCFVYD